MLECSKLTGTASSMISVMDSAVTSYALVRSHSLSEFCNRVLVWWTFCWIPLLSSERKSTSDLPNYVKLTKTGYFELILYSIYRFVHPWYRYPGCERCHQLRLPENGWDILASNWSFGSVWTLGYRNQSDYLWRSFCPASYWERTKHWNQAHS